MKYYTGESQGYVQACLLGAEYCVYRKDKKDRNMPSNFTTIVENVGHVYESKACTLFLRRDPMDSNREEQLINDIKNKTSL